MILLFSLIAITTIWCLGIKIVTGEDMALESVGKWAEKKYEEGHKWVEPLVYCLWCMPSIHSSIGFLFGYEIGLYEWHWAVLWYYPLVVAGSSLLNGLIWQYHEAKNQEKEYYDNLNGNNDIE